MDRLKLLEWCKKRCNNVDLTDTNDFSLVLDQLTTLFENVGVSSESISGLSQSFSSDVNKEIKLLLSPYKKAKFL